MYRMKGTRAKYAYNMKSRTLNTQEQKIQRERQSNVYIHMKSSTLLIHKAFRKTGSIQQVKNVKINIFLILTSTTCWIKPVFRIPAPLGIRYVDMPSF